MFDHVDLDLPSLKRETVKAWIKQYAAEQGQKQPDKLEVHLSDVLTLEELWDEYNESLSDADTRKKCSLSYWYKIFEEEFKKWLKIPNVNRFSQCDVCASIKLLKEGLSKSQKGKIVLFSIASIIIYPQICTDGFANVSMMQGNTTAH